MKSLLLNWKLYYARNSRVKLIQISQTTWVSWMLICLSAPDNKFKRYLQSWVYVILLGVPLSRERRVVIYFFKAIIRKYIYSTAAGFFSLQHVYYKVAYPSQKVLIIFSSYEWKKIGLERFQKGFWS